MTNTERIDDLFGRLQSQPLSAVVPMVLPLALEYQDYEGYCILSYWTKPFSKEKDANVALRRGMHQILLGEGIDSKEAARIENTSFEIYIKIRTIEKGLVHTLSAKEIEDQLKNYGDIISAIDVPQGLNPIDLYARSQAATNEKLKVIENRQILEKQYAYLLSFLTTKLTEYRRKASTMERKQAVENGIKNTKDVFIIHGHNEAKRRELEAILRERFSLNPIVLSEQPDQGLTIIEKFEKYASTCSYAFALFTPDDIVTNNGQQYFQARPNVIFELGWFYANLGRSRVCILDQASEQSKIFSDLQGVMRMQFKENISEKHYEIERELKSVGII